MRLHLRISHRVIYLKDHDFALISADNVGAYQSDGTPANRETVIVAASPGIVDKGGYRHFMEKEIHEQPDAIAHPLAAMTDIDGQLTATMQAEDLRAINGIVALAGVPAIMLRRWRAIGLKLWLKCRLFVRWRRNTGIVIR